MSLELVNTLAGLLHTVVVFEGADYQSNIAWVKNELPAKMKDPAFVADLHYPRSLSRTDHPELAIADLWEQTGVMDLAGYSVVSCWKSIVDVIGIRREVGGESQYENFEHLASRAFEWEKRHPTSYPADTPKLLERKQR